MSKVLCEGLDLVKPEASTTLGFSGHKPKSSLISISHFELSFCPFQIKSPGVEIFFYLKNHRRKKQLHKLVIVRVTTESPWVLLGTGLGRRLTLSIRLKFSDY